MCLEQTSSTSVRGHAETTMKLIYIPLNPWILDKMLGKSQSLSGSTLQMDEKFSILRSGLSKVSLTDAKNWLKPQTSQFNQKQNYLSKERNRVSEQGNGIQIPS